MKLMEWTVPCELCGAKIGEPCVKNINGKVEEIYDTDVHVVRIRKHRGLK